MSIISETGQDRDTCEALPDFIRSQQFPEKHLLKHSPFSWMQCTRVKELCGSLLKGEKRDVNTMTVSFAGALLGHQLLERKRNDILFRQSLG